jgi:hypothetical protein
MDHEHPELAFDHVQGAKDSRRPSRVYQHVE